MPDNMVIKKYSLHLTIYAHM